MGQASAKWIQNQTFLGMDSSNHSIVLSGVPDGKGVNPSEMLLVALATCTAISVVEILRKKKTPLGNLEIKVFGEQDADPPWTFRAIHMKFLASGRGLTEKNLHQAIEISEARYCSVAATIRGVAKISWDFEILPEFESSNLIQQ
jgi:putative redox protein